ncbi:hypothetical protein M407DRAFT_24798 [Tulasnella calospora MUT 4182]|uniref:Uncharacterized protein n=1 Tax=Tulasnella calospora MUT 4182 TaxID=1051891 RepID=A0A0C3QH85_9AGAM|nr:hypothetical protein M407DRAFT_24798 [Tulasnella calospora MUT 4182]
MLRRQETLIAADFYQHFYNEKQPRFQRHTSVRSFPQDIVPPRTPSPGEVSSSASSGGGVDQFYDDDEDFPVAIDTPRIAFTTRERHYEFWDPKVCDSLLFVSGSLRLPQDRITVPHSGDTLSFSHFELELKTHGHQGRHSRENIWSPSYIDYASTPIHSPQAQHLARTRARSYITFMHHRMSKEGEVYLDYKIGLPQHLFWTMRTRNLRLTARAIFLEWRRNQVVETEVIEADPMIISVSLLRMADYVLDC